MLKISLLLHFYQPPTQSDNITDQVMQSCYLPLLDLLAAHPKAHFTLNFSGQLSELLKTRVEPLLERGQIELAESPLYHPLLPLVPVEEIKRETNNIFYPPELAINQFVLEKLSGTVIIDESSLSFHAKLNNKILVVNNRKICELFRSYPRELTLETVRKFIAKDVFWANDAELFGHHYTERINLLAEMLKNYQFLKVSEFINQNQPKEITLDQISPSTWMTTDKNNPYPLWLDPENKLQNDYHNLAQLTYQLLKKSPEPNPAAKNHYEKGLSSCHYYWLSCKPWWHPDLVESGARELIRCIRSLYIDREEKAKAEKIYHQFLMNLWDYHWSGEVEKNWQKYNQERNKFSNFSSYLA